MMFKNLPGFHRPRLLGLMLLCCLVLFHRPAHAQLDGVSGAGIIEEEGEYLSDQVWTKDDTINIATELITSGGEASFEIYYYVAKYWLHVFISTAVKPVEFWIRYTQTWRFETGLRSPEDFRMMTGFFLDKRVEIGWMQAYCTHLTKREGWDHVYPRPFIAVHPNVELTEIEGGFDMDGTPEAEPGPGANERAAERGVPGGNRDWPPTGYDGQVIRITQEQAKNFEFSVNEGAKAGFYEKSLGIPAGSRYIDMSYHGGVNGPDGLFVSANGDCWLLETKAAADGRGRLGRISLGANRHITQCSPQWLMKAMLRVAKEDKERFARILNSLDADSGLRQVMNVVNYMADGNNFTNLLAKYGRESAQELENFYNPVILREILEDAKFSEENIKKIGDFWGKSFNVSIANGYAKNPRRSQSVVNSIKHFASAFGSSVSDGRQLLRCGHIKP